MPLDPQYRHRTFERFDRQLVKLAEKPVAQSVHRFRTYGRRIEALLDSALLEPKWNDRKLLKVLSRLRKKAGRVRDLDVEISALRSLKIPEDAKRKSQLIRTLVEERIGREHKLVKAFDAETIKELRKRLKRAVADIPDATDPLALSLRELSALDQDHTPLSEDTLHQYRIAGKRARYLAELAGKDPKAVRIVQILKRMQDVIGDWHDWLKLTERAEQMFGESRDSALVSALRNVTQAKFRKSLEAVKEARAELAAKKPASSVEAVRRGPSAAVRSAAVAA